LEEEKEGGDDREKGNVRPQGETMPLKNKKLQRRGPAERGGMIRRRDSIPAFLFCVPGSC